MTSVKISDTYRFIYIRHVGKVGGLTVTRGHFEPKLCDLHYPYNTTLKWFYPSTWLPSGCLGYLARQRIYYDAPSLEKQSRMDLKNYTIFAFLRDPRERAVSAYLWGLPTFGREESRQEPFPLEDFIKDAEQMKLHGRPHPHWHWFTQAKGLFIANVPRLDFIGCVHSLRSDFNRLAAALNSREEVLRGDVPTLPEMPAESFRNAAPGQGPRKRLMTRMQSERGLQDSVCSQFYRADCALVPCATPELE